MIAVGHVQSSAVNGGWHGYGGGVLELGRSLRWDVIVSVDGDYQMVDSSFITICKEKEKQMQTMLV